MPLYFQHSHGGQLHLASQKYGIALADWLDLSTGISPFVYPLPAVPNNCWQRLPEADDGLEIVAQKYYGSAFLLPVSGSQETIQALPLLFPSKQRVGIIKPAYHSHQQAWQNAGHEIITLSSAEIKTQINNLNILIIVNPTNPTAKTFSAETLLSWHQSLVKRGGTLIVDEAFIDATEKHSLIKESPQKGLIVLRSIGKFFGLAGIRLGFVWAEENILKQLAKKQNDWSVSHPARWAGKQALQDYEWHEKQRELLPQHSQRLTNLLEKLIFTKPLETGGVYFNTTNQHVHHTALFAYFQHPRAKIIYQQLAQQAVLTRLFEGENPALRFGLPANESEWTKLSQALKKLKL